MLSIPVEEDVIDADQTASLEYSLGLGIEYLTTDVDVHFPGLGIGFKDNIIHLKSHWLELVQIVQNEGVGSVLQEGSHLDGIFVEELGEVNLEGGWEQLKQVVHVLRGRFVK